MRFAFDQSYLNSLQLSSDDFELRYLSYWVVEGPKMQSMTAFARATSQRGELGPIRVGLISLMAQALPQTPLQGPRGWSTKGVQFEVAEEIVAIAANSMTAQVDSLQIARTNWFLGELAFEEYRPDLSTKFFTIAAESYVSRRLWPQVTTLYSNLGISEAGAGHTGSALGWLSLAAQVSRSLNDNDGAGLKMKLADEIKKEPVRFFAPTMQLKKVLASQNIQPPQAKIAEVYGLGVVAVSALTPTVLEALRLPDTIGDTLLDLIEEEWPEGVIAAAAVDLRIISRILEKPDLLDDLEPRAFEVLISKLFQGFSAEVELTKETRDGGYDVGATFEIGSVRFRVLIEAKKWKSRKVGIATVDRLIGVKQRLGADKVVLATTSTFTSVAKGVAAQLHTEIELVDSEGVHKWVERYLLPTEGSAIRLPSIDVGAYESKPLRR